MSGFLSRRGLLLSGAGAGLAASIGARPAFAQPTALAGMDGVAESFLKTFQTPGVALGVVQMGGEDWMRGYGVPLDRYVGLYRDPWYGDMRITRQGRGLAIEMIKTPASKGPLEVWGLDTFRTRFADRTVEDAIVTFSMEPAPGGPEVIGVNLKALSPLADFSYDFHHLEFTPVR